MCNCSRWVHAKLCLLNSGRFKGVTKVYSSLTVWAADKYFFSTSISYLYHLIFKPCTYPAYWNGFPKSMCMHVCLYICLSFHTNMSKPLTGKSSPHTRYRLTNPAFLVVFSVVSQVKTIAFLVGSQETRISLFWRWVWSVLMQTKMKSSPEALLAEFSWNNAIGNWSIN